MYIPSSLTIISNLSPFVKLNPSTTGFGNTITELEPTDVMVTVYLVGNYYDTSLYLYLILITNQY
jgi:hypothetical protein